MGSQAVSCRTKKRFNIDTCGKQGCLNSSSVTTVTLPASDAVKKRRITRSTHAVEHPGNVETTIQTELMTLPGNAKDIVDTLCTGSDDHVNATMDRPRVGSLCGWLKPPIKVRRSRRPTPADSIQKTSRACTCQHANSKGPASTTRCQATRIPGFTLVPPSMCYIGCHHDLPCGANRGVDTCRSPSVHVNLLSSQRKCSCYPFQATMWDPLQCSTPAALQRMDAATECMLIQLRDETAAEALAGLPAIMPDIGSLPIAGDASTSLLLWQAKVHCSMPCSMLSQLFQTCE
jgi:hypothetical protein